MVEVDQRLADLEAAIIALKEEIIELKVELAALNEDNE